MRSLQKMPGTQVGTHCALMERSLVNGGRSIIVNRLKKAPLVTEHVVFDQASNGSCD